MTSLTNKHTPALRRAWQLLIEENETQSSPVNLGETSSGESLFLALEKVGTIFALSLKAWKETICTIEVRTGEDEFLCSMEAAINEHEQQLTQKRIQRWRESLIIGPNWVKPSIKPRANRAAYSAHNAKRLGAR